MLLILQKLQRFKILQMKHIKNDIKPQKITKLQPYIRASACSKIMINALIFNMEQFIL